MDFETARTTAVFALGAAWWELYSRPSRVKAGPREQVAPRPRTTTTTTTTTSTPAAEAFVGGDVARSEEAALQAAPDVPWYQTREAAAGPEHPDIVVCLIPSVFYDT